MSIRNKIVSMVTALLVALTLSAVAASPASAKAGPRRCQVNTSTQTYTAAGIQFSMQSYTQWMDNQYYSQVNLSSTITKIRTTNGKSLSKHNLVEYVQMGNSSAKWTNAKRFTFSASPKWRSFFAQNNVKHGNPNSYYGKKVRFIVNAQSHTFAGPWLTIGGGYEC